MQKPIMRHLTPVESHALPTETNCPLEWFSPEKLKPNETANTQLLLVIPVQWLSPMAKQTAFWFKRFYFLYPGRQLEISAKSNNDILQSGHSLLNPGYVYNNPVELVQPDLHFHESTGSVLFFPEDSSHIPSPVSKKRRWITINAPFWSIVLLVEGMKIHMWLRPGHSKPIPFIGTAKYW